MAQARALIMDSGEEGPTQGNVFTRWRLAQQVVQEGDGIDDLTRQVRMASKVSLEVTQLELSRSPNGDMERIRRCTCRTRTRVWLITIQVNIDPEFATSGREVLLVPVNVSQPNFALKKELTKRAYCHRKSPQAGNAPVLDWRSRSS